MKSAPEMNRIEWNHIGSVRFSSAQLWLNQNQITSAVVYHHSFPTKIAWGMMGHPSFSQSTVGLIPSNCFLEFPIKSPPQFMIRYNIFHRKLWRVLDLGKGIWFRVQTPQESWIPWKRIYTVDWSIYIFIYQRIVQTAKKYELTSSSWPLTYRSNWFCRWLETLREEKSTKKWPPAGLVIKYPEVKVIKIKINVFL